MAHPTLPESPLVVPQSIVADSVTAVQATQEMQQMQFYEQSRPTYAIPENYQQPLTGQYMAGGHLVVPSSDFLYNPPRSCWGNAEVQREAFF